MLLLFFILSLCAPFVQGSRVVTRQQWTVLGHPYECPLRTPSIAPDLKGQLEQLAPTLRTNHEHLIFIKNISFKSIFPVH